MKISIIIPVYNAAAYTGRALQSVLFQTWPDLECILVNDASPDNSRAVIEQKLAGYTGPVDVKLIDHPENRGIAAARNTGFDAATGQYVFFMDCDDLLVPDTLALLAEPLQTEPLDLVVGGYASNGVCVRPLAARTMHDNHQIVRSYCQEQWYPMVWNKLVRRRFLIDNNLRFDSVLHEDELWSFKVAALAQSMACISPITYLYCFRCDSFMHTRTRKRLDAQIEIVQIAEAFLQEKNLTDNTDLGCFLFQWRERLGHIAWPYGKKLAWDVYRQHVRHRPAFIQTGGQDRKCCCRHAALPAPLGFAWYMTCKYLRRKFAPLFRS